jgi:hypothetical protein
VSGIGLRELAFRLRRGVVRDVDAGKRRDRLDDLADLRLIEREQRQRHARIHGQLRQRRHASACSRIASIGDFGRESSIC